MLVSILVSNYNYGRYLEEAIDSALGQEWPHLEVVVADDGSTDRSRELLASYGNRVSTVFKENGGQASALNAAFAASKGEVVALLDADDWFEPGKIGRVVAELRDHPEAGWLAHSLTPVAEVTPEHRSRGRVWKTGGSGDYTAAVRMGRTKLLPHLPATSGLVFRRKLLERIMPIPEELGITADNYLKLAALLTSPVRILDQPLACQRIHGANRYTLQAGKSSRFMKTVRSVNRGVACGLAHLEPSQKTSLRLVANNIRTALSDFDCHDLAGDLLLLCRLSSPFHPFRGQ